MYQLHRFRNNCKHIHLFTRSRFLQGAESLFRNRPRKDRTKASCTRDLRGLERRRREKDEECRVEILDYFARFDSKRSLFIPNQRKIREILANDSKRFTRENVRKIIFDGALNSSRIVPLYAICSKNLREFSFFSEVAYISIERFITRFLSNFYLK